MTNTFVSRLRSLWNRHRLLGVLLAGSLLVPSAAPAARAAAAAEDTFTLAIVPDTQQEVLKPDDSRLKDRFQWLVDHRKELNLKIMMQTGDFMNWDTPDHFQYERASDALTVLDRADFPYALAIGNHDSAATKMGGSAAPGNVHDNQRNTATFNHYFPVSRQKRLEGFYEPGKVDNAYQTFTAGGLNWLVINMELWARTGVVEWAKKVADDHPNYNVIMITHSFLSGGGRTSFRPAPPPAAVTAVGGSAVSAAPSFGAAAPAGAPPIGVAAGSEIPKGDGGKTAIEQRNGGYGDNSPQFVFDHFLSLCPNVRLVFCGHVGIYGYHTDKGVKGNTIYEFLTTYHSNIDNPVRLLTVDTKNGTMSTHVFCPSTGRDKDTGSAFTVKDIHWVPTDAK